MRGFKGMDVQAALDMLLGVLVAFGGWILNRVTGDIRQLQDKIARHADDLSDVRVEYATRAEMHTMLDRVLNTLQRIEDKLDRKADKI
ncbi:MAG: hypothetical protein ACRD98_00240 [Nitrososphaera sp.]